MFAVQRLEDFYRGMRFAYPVLLVVACLNAGGISPASASAQTVADRIVGLSEAGTPLTVWRVDGQQIATLGKAAGMPMGFEGTWPVRHELLSIAASKRPLRAVLDALVAADPRYEWREDDGVIVVRPIESWGNVSSALHAPVAGTTLDNITAGDALDYLAQLVGSRREFLELDTQRFSVEIRDGSTWLEALNAIVRAHGTLTWIIEPSDPSPSNRDYPLRIMLNTGAGGVGFGVRADAILSPSAANRRRELETGQPEPPILERIVGTGRLGDPIRAYGASPSLAVSLAESVGVPIGFEGLPATEGSSWLHEGISISGMTLRQALDVLVSLDPRYEWRDMDGVIVLRPVKAWLSSENPLFRLMPSIALTDVPAVAAIAELAAALKAPHNSISGLPDTRTFSVDMPRGTLLDVLNAIVRAHGQLTWLWENIPRGGRQTPPGVRHELTFWLHRGHGVGIQVP